MKPTVKKQSLVTLLFITLIFAFLIAPALAMEDLSNETYITPAYKIQLEGNYKYMRDDIKWYWNYPNFDSPNTVVNGNYINGTLGTYPIYHRADEIEFGICLESEFTGTLYLTFYYYDNSGTLQQDKFPVKEIKYSSECAEKTVQIPNTYYGNIYYRWEFYSNEIWKYSDTYSLFLYENLNSNWKYRKPIAISSTKKLNEGIIKVKLNDTNFYNHSRTKYDEDDNEVGFSGTLTDIVITDEQQTKVYPYFIDTYKGGFYNYSRESSNDTYIIVYLNENATQKSLYMYYDYEISYDYSYLFGHKNSDFLHTDFLNNPFGIYQVFTDWRWTKTFMENNLDLSENSGSGSIDRQNSYTTGGTTNMYFFKNNLTKINFKYRTRSVDSYIAELLKLYRNSSNTLYEAQSKYDSSFFRKLHNSTNDYVDTGGSNSDVVASINISNDKLQLLLIDLYSNTTLSINETQLYFKLYKLYLYDQSGSSSYSKCYYIKSKTENSVSYTLSNETVTQYSIVNFMSMNEYSTFINDLWIGGIISTDTQGTIMCSDTNGNVLGSIETPKTIIAQTYEIIFPYLFLNRTDFLSRDNFTYTCKFISDTGYEVLSNENYTITFQNNRTYISSISPTTQYSFASLYIPISIDLELNYTGINTDIDLIVDSITCNSEYLDKCLEYDVNSLADSYSEDNIATSYSSTNVFKLTDANWYEYYFRINKSGTISSTPSRLFYVLETSPFKPPADNYIDWNDTELTNNTEFMQIRFWNNPLSYLSSMLYQKFIIPNVTNASAQSIFLWVFTVFWNFYTILIVIAISIYQVVPNIVLSIAGTIPFLLIFSYIGWIGIASTTIYLLIAIVITVKLWKQ